mmetsp:Transcript_8441/g.20879  ORF Transcript_8441/g.20879 Transcript_8441/m.20879 type:complete len:208 (+) Transcript_8441:459-1082(+)
MEARHRLQHAPCLVRGACLYLQVGLGWHRCPPLVLQLRSFDLLPWPPSFALSFAEQAPRVARTPVRAARRLPLSLRQPHSRHLPVVAPAVRRAVHEAPPPSVMPLPPLRPATLVVSPHSSRRLGSPPLRSSRTATPARGQLAQRRRETMRPAVRFPGTLPPSLQSHTHARSPLLPPWRRQRPELLRWKDGFGGIWQCSRARGFAGAR